MIPAIVHPNRMVYVLSAEEHEVHGRAMALFAACHEGVMLPSSPELMKLAQEVGTPH